jgi:hypothetical protein
MEASGQLHAPSTLSPQIQPPVPLHLRLGGLRAGLEVVYVRKIACSAGNRTTVVQPAAYSYIPMSIYHGIKTVAYANISESCESQLYHKYLPKRQSHLKALEPYQVTHFKYSFGFAPAQKAALYPTD